MIEYLAIPARETEPTRLVAWVDRLGPDGSPVKVDRESSTVAWIEVATLRLRGYVLLENGHASAINFELNAPEPAPALRAITAAAEALGWEIHADDGEDDDDPDDA